MTVFIIYRSLLDTEANDSADTRKTLCVASNKTKCDDFIRDRKREANNLGLSNIRFTWEEVLYIQ